ncbi:hypothetical protein HYU12_03995 [Candidatus Woesearchaeota archaeon]|nr:hypothetical protein [Candidatus Woesearchaeota archaeon]
MPHMKDSTASEALEVLLNSEMYLFIAASSACHTSSCWNSAPAESFQSATRIPI